MTDLEIVDYKILSYLSNTFIIEWEVTDDVLEANFNLFDKTLFEFSKLKLNQSNFISKVNNIWCITELGKDKLMNLKEIASLNVKNETLQDQNYRLQNKLMEIQIPNERNKYRYSFISFIAGALVSLGIAYISKNIWESKELKEIPIKVLIDINHPKNDTTYKIESKYVQTKK